MSKVCSASTSCTHVGYSIDVVQCLHDCVREEYTVYAALPDCTPVFDFGGDIAKAEGVIDRGCRWR